MPKRPEPSGSATAGAPTKAPLRNRTFKDLVASDEPLVAATAKRLRELVLRLEPGAIEHIYGGPRVGIALYSIGTPNRVLCGIQPSRRQCLFYVHHVTEADAPELRLQGTGKNSRHLTFKAPPEVDVKALRSLLKLARERMGA